MATNIQPSAALPQSSVVQPSFRNIAEKYAPFATSNAFMTLAFTIANPVVGLAYGAYSLTDIAVSIAADKFGWDQIGVVARICKAALATILGIGAAFAVLSAFGATPMIASVVIPALCFTAVRLLEFRPTA